jgi:hypothetical protein
MPFFVICLMYIQVSPPPPHHLMKSRLCVDTSPLTTCWTNATVHSLVWMVWPVMSIGLLYLKYCSFTSNTLLANLLGNQGICGWDCLLSNWCSNSQIMIIYKESNTSASQDTQMGQLVFRNFQKRNRWILPKRSLSPRPKELVGEAKFWWGNEEIHLTLLTICLQQA